MSSNLRVTSSNPLVTSSNPQVRRLKARVRRLKARVGRFKARVGRFKAQVRRLKARVEAIKPRVIEFQELQKFYFHCLANAELKPYTKVLKNLFLNMTLKEHLTAILPSYFSS